MGKATISGSDVITEGMIDKDHMHFSEDFLVSEGVVGLTDGAVSQNHLGVNKSVDVAPGRFYVPNHNWSANSSIQTRFWTVTSSAIENVVVTPNVSGNPRIDLICMKVDTSIAPGDDGELGAYLTVVVGTPAASPSAPAVPNDCLVLAQVTLANGYASISNANITDRRKYVQLKSNNLNNDWRYANETWAYASASTVVNTNTLNFGVITIPAGGLTRYAPGMFIEITQTTEKFGIIHKVEDTQLTVNFGTDYVLANAAIINPRFTSSKSPIGFSKDADKWDAITTSTSDVSVNPVTVNTIYNPGSLGVSVPLGLWKITTQYEAGFENVSTTSTPIGEFALSTANNAITGKDWYVNTQLNVTIASSTSQVYSPVSLAAIKNLTTLTPYYLVAKQTRGSATAGNNSIRIFGSTYMPTILRAENRYLN